MRSAGGRLALRKPSARGSGSSAAVGFASSLAAVGSAALASGAGVFATVGSEVGAWGGAAGVLAQPARVIAKVKKRETDRASMGMLFGSGSVSFALHAELLLRMVERRAERELKSSRKNEWEP